MTDPSAVAAAVAASIRAGSDAADAMLDGAYPEAFRRFRPQHATPVEVAATAAAWLAEAGATRVLDVGAGAGRFCVAGALVTDLAFTGVERRPWLVEAARTAAGALGASRARFVCGDVRDVDWAAHDGFYLFNPFAEHHLDEGDCIDLAWPRGRDGFDADVTFVEDALAAAPSGTPVVTWNGFGGDLRDYTCERRAWARHAWLERWRHR